MRTGLERRLRALEASVPDPEEPRKPLVPGWLMEEWLAQGLQFDASDDSSVRSTVRIAGVERQRELSARRPEPNWSRS